MRTLPKSIVFAASILAGTGLLALTGTAPAQAPITVPSPPLTSSVDKCAALSSLPLANIQIEIAQTMPSGAPIEGARMPDMMGGNTGPLVSGLPAFCRVAGRMHPEAGSDIRFEVWLPAARWDGRLFGAGNGGFAGSLSYMELAQYVRHGQAAATTDTGHSGSALDAAWAKGNPAKVRDYGWRAVHLTAMIGKQLAAAFYGHGPNRSYFVSCSNGGRQALMEAARFPEDYDGIVAGAPASDFAGLITSMINTVKAQMPDDARLSLPQLDLLQAEVLKQCDGLDGQVDGLVSNPLQCHVNLTRLACGASTSPQCLKPAQIAAVRQISEGPKDRAGRLVAPGYMLTGAEVGVPKFFSWEAWIIGVMGRPSSHYSFAMGVLGDFANGSLGDIKTYDFSRDPQRLDALLTADLRPQADLRRFFGRGGKLIMYHGWSDAAIPAQFTLDYYDRAMKLSGGQAGSSLRLFMIPGMQHCAGGPGPNSFGAMTPDKPGDMPERNVGTAMVDWVEKGRAPDTLIATRSAANFMTPEQGAKAPQAARERLICAWPRRAVLRAGADPDIASSYRCVLVGRARN